MKEKAKKLTEKQRIFCHEYVIDFNGARAYKVAYPNVTDGTARTNAHKLLTNANIKGYVKSIQGNLAELAGVSALRNIMELKKIAYSSISDLHDTWIERKDFESLTEDQKSCIESIETKIEKRTIKVDGSQDVDVEVQYVKIKMYAKISAIDLMNKMLGWNQPSKIDLTTLGKEIKQRPTIVFTTFNNEDRDSEEV